MQAEQIQTERWQRIEKLFNAMLERSPQERAAFLAEACAGDEELRCELESLLAVYEQGGSLLESPAADLAAEWLQMLRPPLSQTLSHFRLLSLLGKGGMGEVWLAEDSRLQRKAALKLLPAEFTSQVDRLRRFEQEARAASALNHPNIITIYEIDQANGTHFMATEFVEGQTLRALVKQGRLELATALDVTLQVASALEAAHTAGIIHRDIKPENIMVRTDGLVKVLDFGLAKLVKPQTAAPDTQTASVASRATAPGMVMGTVGYMSPEQARGLEVDARTDIFSLGVVLYEMLAGCAPFEGATASDVTAAILKTEPLPLSHYRPQAPDELQRLISNALCKNLEQRWQTIKELRLELKALRQLVTDDRTLGACQPELDSVGPTEGLARTSARTPASADEAAAARAAFLPRTRQVVFGLLAVALLVLIGVGLYWRNGRNSEATIDSIAILPFVNVGADPNTEYLADGIPETLINNFSRLSKLRVVPRGIVFGFKGQPVDPQMVGRKLGVRAVLTGKVEPRGEMLKIQVDLVDVERVATLWGDQYNRQSADLLAIQEEIARQIIEALQLRLSGEERRQLAKSYPKNTAAYQAYVKGRFWWNKRYAEGFRRAIGYFNQAIAADPNYALAYAGLADCHTVLSPYGILPPEESAPKAKVAALKALQLDEQLAEAHASLANFTWLHEWDWARAEHEFRRAIELNPAYATAHQWFSVYLSSMARHPEAIAQAKQAQELDPLSLAIYRDLARVYYHARQYDHAIETWLKSLELDPNHYRINSWLDMAYEQKGLYDQALAVRVKASARIGVNPETVAALNRAYAVSGWQGYWQKELEVTKQQARRIYILPYSIARIYARLGDKERTFEFLEKAYAEHSDHLVLLKVDPLFDSLRSDPRFTDLLRRVGLAP